jgi:hypothetical protein
MHMRITTLIAAALAVFAAADAAGQQTWNPTASFDGNTAGGTNALPEGSGAGNTAFGGAALMSNTAGWYNTATGTSALVYNTTGNYNTAVGYSALYYNQVGWSNTAVGAYALLSNGTGTQNTGMGLYALYVNSTGSYNTAMGVGALQNDGASNNSAFGINTLHANTSGSANTADGPNALIGNITGSNNTAVGYYALQSNTAGSGNVALGANAGHLTTGSNNIDVANAGVAGESGTIRIGTAGTHDKVFVAGVHGTSLAGSEVVVTASGQLGTVQSSARYKRDVADMGESSARLAKLRPVTFKYKADESGATQYGLIAEEVAQVYPELVVRNTDGQVESVQYHELIAMLLNEAQHQAREIADLKTALAAQGQRLAQIEGSASPAH